MYHSLQPRLLRNHDHQDNASQHKSSQSLSSDDVNMSFSPPLATAAWFGLCTVSCAPVSAGVFGYLSDKAPGIQTVLDQVHRDVVRANVASVGAFCFA